VQEYHPTVTVLELTSKTTYEPFPNLEYQSHIISCLSLRIDSKDRLWLLDYAHHGFRGTPTLTGFQLADQNGATDQQVVSYAFPPEVAGMGSMLNDFAIDPSGQYLYIIDTSIIATSPAIIVYSVKLNAAFRMLAGHSSMYGDSVFLNVLGNVIKFGPFGLTINADSIALDRSGIRLG
jgi:hypothetical protein